MHQLSSSNHTLLPARARIRLLPVHLLLCLFLVFAQSAALVHSHEGDLQKQFDCDICLKLSSTDHAIASTAFDFAELKTTSAESLPQFHAITISPAVFHARAPPFLI